MQILYTHDIFARQQYGGISRYFVELIQHLIELKSDIRVFAGDHINEHLQALDGHAGLIGRYGRSRKPFRFYRQFWNRVRQERLLSKSETQVAHHTYYSFSRPLNPARLVVTIHDLIPERFPEQFGWKARLLTIAKRRSCTFADRILVNSLTTKNDLVNEFGIATEKIDVTYLGNSLKCYADQPLPNLQHRPYILYVGSRSGYKNCRLLFEAFAQSVRLQQDFSLVCFGGGCWSSSEQQLLDELGISRLVVQDAGDDRKLASYYKHAAAFVYPSIYEGFGIPTVEAMNFGCPIIASTGGSIPEVVNSAGVYFDPTDSAMLQECLESVLYDEQLKAELRQEMELRLPLYRWEETARQTLECYQKAAA